MALRLSILIALVLVGACAQDKLRRPVPPKTADIATVRTAVSATNVGSAGAEVPLQAITPAPTPSVTDALAADIRATVEALRPQFVQLQNDGDKSGGACSGQARQMIIAAMEHTIAESGANPGQALTALAQAQGTGAANDDLSLCASQAYTSVSEIVAGSTGATGSAGSGYSGSGGHWYHHHRTRPPTNPATGPPSQPTEADATLRVASQTRKVKVRYEPLKQLELRKPVTFTAAVELLGEGSSKPLFSGPTTTGDANVRRQVCASLTGPPHVTIKLRRDPCQPVTDLTNPYWVWDLTATDVEPALLDMSISSSVIVDGQGQEVYREVYHAQVPVHVGPIDAAKNLIDRIDPIWRWIVGVGTAIAGGLTWYFTWYLKLRRRGPTE